MGRGGVDRYLVSPLMVVKFVTYATRDIDGLVGINRSRRIEDKMKKKGAGEIPLVK